MVGQWGCQVIRKKIDLGTFGSVWWLGSRDQRTEVRARDTLIFLLVQNGGTLAMCEITGGG